MVRIALLLSLVLSSCLTTTLWEMDVHDESGGGSSAWYELCVRACLTPLTLVLDCITYPLQERLLLEEKDC